MTALGSHSLFNRLTWASALIGVLATVLLYFAAAYTVRQHVNAALARTVDTDMAGLVDIYASDGRAELERRLADRLAFAAKSGEQPHYLLADAKGNPLAGDLQRVSHLSAASSEAHAVTLASGATMLGRMTQLGPNLQLFVGRENADLGSLLREVAWAFALAGLGVVLTLVAAGRVATRQLRMRVTNLNSSFLQAEAASYSPETPPSRDELDELSRHVGGILKRQSALVASHRNVSDQTAHELRTPLMHLDMRLQRAIDQSPSDGLTETLLAARAEIKRIIRMLESLLDIASNEALRFDPSRLEETNLSELAISLADLFSESAEEAGLALEAAITPDVTMRCDAMQITRMLSNLLDNALKYVPSGGTIRLSVEAGPKICVIDNGPGIPAAMREVIFERFKRSESVTEEGHGLGLALVRAIAERHGLSVRCDDAHPGAAFIIAAKGL
jgi:signal transduction histidine kinase